MRFLLDQNLSPKTTEFLRIGLDHDATDIREQGLEGASDQEIMAFAIGENRIVLTYNSDFGNILEFPPGEYPGVIRLRVHPQTLEVLHPVLEQFLAQVRPEDIEGALVILDNWHYRIRR